ncbi:MAG TPA: hypothetical protein PLV93_08080, partial [Microthrixaceae bacterium]|nr:hypothetical protein [Microthrixaceae bacterium]
ERTPDKGEVAGSIPASPTTSTGSRREERSLRALRRAVIALGLGGLGAIVLKLRGSSGGTPTQAGGWRELSGDHFR